MPSKLDYIRAKVVANKTTLEGSTQKQKEGHISIQTAQQVNAIMVEIKKEAPEVASHLPQAISWNGPRARLVQQADVSFLELEMMLNQVLAVLDVLRAEH